MITNNRLTRVHLLTFTQIHVHIILLLKLLGMFEHQQGNPIKNKKTSTRETPKTKTCTCPKKREEIVTFLAIFSAKCNIVVAAALVLTILFF